MANKVSTAGKPKLGKSASAGGGGAVMTVHHQERGEKIYPVMESELNSLSLFNAAASGLFSVGAFYLSIATRDGIDNIDYGSVEFMVSAAMFGLGILHLCLRGSVVRHIKKNSKSR